MSPPEHALVLAVEPVARSSPSITRRHRHQEFFRFLKLIDGAVPKWLELHLVLDNYASHKTPRSRSGWSGIPGSTCTSPRPTAACCQRVTGPGR
jgi:hypothetical protein